MKKMLAALLAAMMMLTLAACGGGSDTKTVDVQKLADDLKSNVPYSADMSATAVEDLNYKLDPPEGTTIAGYMADGNTADPVSYTHLDVYKRQVPSRTSACGRPKRCLTTC